MTAAHMHPIYHSQTLMNNSISVITQDTTAHPLLVSNHDNYEQRSYFESIRQLIRFLIQWVGEGQKKRLNYKQNPKVKVNST